VYSVIPAATVADGKTVAGRLDPAGDSYSTPPPRRPVVHRVALDLRQEDCPLTRASAEHDVEMTTPHWRLDSGTRRWDLRVRVSADGGDGTLEAALRTLRDAREMEEFRLYAKRDGDAFVRTVFEETTAIDVVGRHGGIVVGPFDQVDGRERWRLGFDDAGDADAALSDLDRHESFSVRDRRRLDPLPERPGGRRDDAGPPTGDSAAATPLRPRATDAVAEAGDRLLRAASLTRTERRTLAVAFAQGYFESPREATLAEVGDRLGVSDVAVSKTLRRAERKLLAATLPAGDDPDSIG
jgi:predicted DNA binding protein